MNAVSAESLHLISDPQVIPRVGDALAHVYGRSDLAQLAAIVGSEAIAMQGCLSLFMEETSADALSQQVDQAKFEQLRSLYQQTTLLNLWYSFELKRVLEAITMAGIPVIVLKGADIASTLYPRPGLRHFGDIDLMVQPGDLAATISLLERLDYSYHQEYNFEAISKRRTAFVYVKKIAIGFLVFEIHSSPHSNEMGIIFDTAQIWKRVRPITISGINVYGMGLEDLFIYLCWHYRSHSFERLIWLYDIALILFRWGDRLDWMQVRSIAREQGLLSTIHYCVFLCDQVFHIQIPKNIELEQFKPPNSVQLLISILVGDNLLSSLRKEAFNDRKLLQRFMVDNLRSLWLVLLRTLFPSPTHLGRLYMEQSRLPLRLFWLYYPIHFLFVLSYVLRIGAKKLLMGKRSGEVEKSV